MSKRTILVTGATGCQGGSVVKALLSQGHMVRAFTRNPDSNQAKYLLEIGAELAVGNFADFASLQKAAAGVDTIFAMSTPFTSSIEDEIQQGITLANAAKASRVGHLIYSSVAGANRNTDIPHFNSKHLIEKHIISLGIPYTISAPTFFMENLLSPNFIANLRQGKLSMPLPAKRKLQQIALDDLGAFVASLVDRRESVFENRFEIASDELTGIEMAEILSQIIGKEILYENDSLENLTTQNEDMAMMFRWFDLVGFSVNISELHKEFCEVRWHTFIEWVRYQNWVEILK